MANPTGGVALPGTAPAADVLTGQTFSGAAGLGVAGTMADQGSPAFTPTDAAQTGPGGYYAGLTVQAIPYWQQGTVSGDGTGTLTVTFTRPVRQVVIYAYMGTTAPTFDGATLLGIFGNAQYAEASVSTTSTVTNVSASGYGTTSVTLSAASGTFNINGGAYRAYGDG